MQRQATHLGEGHDEPNLVPALVELGAHAQAGGGAGVPDQGYHGLEGAQRTPTGIVRLIRLDPKNLQSRTIRLQIDATRPGRRLGFV